MSTPALFAGCGTYGGYQAHRRAHQPACEPCLAANAAESARYRTNPAARDQYRWLNATRSRALERLARRHPAEFLEELAAERAKTETL